MTRRRPDWSVVKADWLTMGAVVTLLFTTLVATFMAREYRADADKLRARLQWQCPQYPHPIILPLPLKKTT